MTTPTLDFAQIRTACPKAFAALIGWFCQGKHFQLGVPTADSPGYATAEWGPYLGADVGVLEVGDFRDQYTLNVRDLFDFFDANGVYLAINTALYGERIFYAQMWLDKLVWLSEEYPTRAAAEAAAFQTAFEKLETLLGKEEK